MKAVAPKSPNHLKSPNVCVPNDGNVLHCFVLLIQWSMRKWRTMAKGVVGMVVVLSCGSRLGLCGVLQCQLTG